jgi:DNA-binding transcriptional MerR regulator
MTALTIQDVSRRSGLSEPTLRYYEEIGLIGPIARDASSGHRRYQDEDLDVLQALACMRALGVGIEDMRVYQANRGRGHEAAAEQRDLLGANVSGCRSISRPAGSATTNRTGRQSSVCENPAAARAAITAGSCSTRCNKSRS